MESNLQVNGGILILFYFYIFDTTSDLFFIDLGNKCGAKVGDVNKTYLSKDRQKCM